MSRACRRILVAASSAALLITQAAPGFAQSVCGEMVQHQVAQANRAENLLGDYRAMRESEDDARGRMQQAGCHLRRNQGAPQCQQLIAYVNALANRRRALERQVASAGGEARLERIWRGGWAARDNCRAAERATPGIDPAAAALLGAVAGGMIGFGVSRASRTHAPAVMGRSNRPMPVQPRRH